MTNLSYHFEYFYRKFSAWMAGGGGGGGGGGGWVGENSNFFKDE